MYDSIILCTLMIQVLGLIYILIYVEDFYCECSDDITFIDFFVNNLITAIASLAVIVCPNIWSLYILVFLFFGALLLDLVKLYYLKRGRYSLVGLIKSFCQDGKAWELLRYLAFPLMILIMTIFSNLGPNKEMRLEILVVGIALVNPVIIYKQKLYRRFNGLLALYYLFVAIPALTKLFIDRSSL